MSHWTGYLVRHRQLFEKYIRQRQDKLSNERDTASEDILAAAAELADISMNRTEADTSCTSAEA